MITKHDLQEAAARYEGEINPSINTCIKLAAVYIVQAQKLGVFDNLAELIPALERIAGKSEIPSYSYAASPETTETPYRYSGAEPAAVGDYGDSDFLRAIAGKDPAAMWAVMDELMDTLKMVNERVYNGVMRRIR